MANTLALSIQFSALAGGALSAFSSVREAISTLTQATSRLSIKQRELGLTLQEKIANRAPISAIAHYTRELEKQTRAVETLKQKTQSLQSIQHKITASQTNRANLRGKLMETAAIGYLAVPIGGTVTVNNFSARYLIVIPRYYALSDEGGSAAGLITVDPPNGSVWRNIDQYPMIQNGNPALCQRIG